MNPRLIVCVFLCLATVLARSELTGANSLEWLAISSPVIVQGVVETYTEAPAESRGQKRVTVRVTEVMKGTLPGKTVTVDLNTAWAASKEKMVDPTTHACLLFLRPGEMNAIDTYVGCKAPALTYQSFIDLQALRDVYSKSMMILTDRDHILAAVKAWASSKITHSLQREVPFDSPIFNRLWGGSSVFLVVPAEESYRAEYLKQARSLQPYERAAAASALSLFPGKETEAVLRELLRDNDWSYEYYTADLITSIEYTVRSRAAASLKALGKTVPANLVLARKPTAEEQRNYRREYWRKSFGESLPDGWTVKGVADGEIQPAFRADFPAVIVNVQHENTTVRFILIPKDWADTPAPAGKYLGWINCQGGRRFYLDGNLPVNVEEKIVRYFGLEKPTPVG